MKPFRFVDLFCGGGGSITGAINALRSAGIQYEGRGFNHWDTAIRTIQANHPEIIPDFNRACSPIESVLPDEIFTEDPERIDVVWASPSCTHHSIAAGGKPKSNQLRSQPEYLLPYLRLTKCRRMFVENVKELRDWGPLLDEDMTWKGRRYKAGTPDPRKKGLFFNLWLREIKASGYKVEMQILNSADFGAATSRERLIIQAVRTSSGEKVIWPEPTHLQDPGLFSSKYKSWRSTAEIIDWSIPGRSIFDRERPLSENTLRRIAAGIEKFWGNMAEPFLILLRGTHDSQLTNTAIPLTRPLPTITTKGDHFALIRPVWLDQAHTKNGGVTGTVDSPLNTITCSHGTHSVIVPFISRYNGGDKRNHSIDAPLPVIDTSNRYGVATPLIDKYYGSETSAHEADKPLATRSVLIQGRILTTPDGKQYKLDITHRMLTAGELARATSFPEGYVFCGGDTAAKKQIGNAVPPVLAEALYKKVLAS